ncbi:MAG: penicillin-binding protein 2 [Deltaproteobacteria bacterium]|nr:penicillin-binding protein 2 [Deltaproteobacteria bacterium]
MWLHLFPASELLDTIAKQHYERNIELSPYRGTIYDHRYVPLAISIKSPSLAVNPRVFNPTNDEIKKLSKLLKISPGKIKELRHKKNYFAWLKRKVGFESSEKVSSMNIKGLHKLTEPARFYPQGTYGAHLIGFVGTDDTGLFGLERAHEKKLSGASINSLRLKDAKGQPIFLSADSALPQQSGLNIVLTLDSVVQEIAEKALAKWTRLARAKHGFAIVSDPHTGRILALANQPEFDPNKPVGLDVQKTINFAVTGLFEPGSVVKPIVIATAIEKKLVGENDVHTCEKNGRLKIDSNNFIHDDHPKEFLTTTEIIVNSSNICAYKIAKRLGKKALWETYRSFGFDSGNTILDLPGATAGRISRPESWGELRFANIAFGQGLLVTGLEMVQAFAVFANGGNLIKPYLIERIESDDGNILFSYNTLQKTKVLSPKTVNFMRKALVRVVTEGTGTLAQSDWYTTAGKTGTAEKVDSSTRRYSAEKRIPNFVGFAPVSDPHILVYIALDEPREKPYYGGKWAAPAFSEIVTKTLKYLNVAPDKANQENEKERLSINQ